MKIVNLARILLNERIFLSYSWLAGKSGKVEWGGRLLFLLSKLRKTNRKRPTHTRPAKKRKKMRMKRKERKGKGSVGKENSVFSVLPATKWKFFNCIFANCRSGLLASNSFQWKLQRKISSHRQHKSCIRPRLHFPREN